MEAKTDLFILSQLILILRSHVHHAAHLLASLL